MIITIAIPPTKTGIIKTVKSRERNKTQERQVIHNTDSQIQGETSSDIFLQWDPSGQADECCQSLIPHWLREAQKDLPGFEWLNITRLLIFPAVNGRSKVSQKALDTVAQL